jgi:hypothetical protein
MFASDVDKARLVAARGGQNGRKAGLMARPTTTTRRSRGTALVTLCAQGPE